MKLTQKSVDALTLPPGKAHHIERDDDLRGYGIRLRKGGSKKYVYAYEISSPQRVQRKLTLGDCSALRERDARKMATELYAKVRLGLDPAGDKAESRAKIAETLGAALRVYLPYQKGRLLEMARFVFR